MASLFDTSSEDIQNTVEKIGKATLKLETFKPQGVLYGILQMFSLSLSWLYSKILDPLRNQTSLKTATGNFLNNWGDMLGVQRMQASKARGTVSLMPQAKGMISAGTIFQVTQIACNDDVLMSDQVQLTFSTVEDVSYLKGVSADLILEATGPGALYNVTNATIQTDIVLPGLSTGDVDANGILLIGELTIFSNKETAGNHFGTDEQSDESYRSDIQQKWLSQGEVSPPSFYESYVVTSIPEIIEAKVVRHSNVTRQVPGGYVIGDAQMILRTDNELFPEQGSSDYLDLIGRVSSLLASKTLYGERVLVTGVKPCYVPLCIDYPDISEASKVSPEEAKKRIQGYFSSLSIGQPYTIHEIYDLFPDVHLIIQSPAQEIRPEYNQTFVIQDVEADVSSLSSYGLSSLYGTGETYA